MYSGRSNLGIPEDWESVEYWIFGQDVPDYPPLPTLEQFQKKFPDIPSLSDYSKIPPKTFWRNFPFNPIPNGPTTRVNVQALEKMLRENSHNFTCHQKRRMEKLLLDLREGAEAYQKGWLPPVTVQNALSAFEHGEMLTDKLASWVDSGIVCGPFNVPPFPGFRANSLAAVERNGSVRPIINMSRPEGFSFNDNLREYRMEKVHMGTARSFGYALKEAGRNSLMSKYDLRDAYKLIPARPGDWRLQGFCWGNKFFFETNMIFGAATSVANFDRLGNMLVECAVAKSGIERKYVSRTLDDIPVIAPAGSANTLRFGMALRGICRNANIQLAENCPDKVKAFEHSKQGVVLGIAFDTERMVWALPAKKADKFTRILIDTIHTDFISLNELQKVMGIINDLVLMCPFLKPWRQEGNHLVGEFNQNEEIVLAVPEQLKMDLAVFARMVATARNGIPICGRPAGPPLFCKQFYSDAAGCKFTWVNGSRVNLEVKEDAGVACLLIQEEQVTWWSDLTWPRSFIEQERDEKGALYGSKTATLEAIGVLLPFLAIPEELVG
jgi:hypothetical protein